MDNSPSLYATIHHRGGETPPPPPLYFCHQDQQATPALPTLAEEEEDEFPPDNPFIWNNQMMVACAGERGGCGYGFVGGGHFDIWMLTLGFVHITQKNQSYY